MGDVEPPPLLLVVGCVGGGVVGEVLGVVDIEVVGLVGGGGVLVGDKLVGIIVGVPTVDDDVLVLVVEMTGVGEEGPILLLLVVVVVVVDDM